MEAPLTDSRRSFVGARTILAGYENYVARFRVITSRAEVRFLDRDWHGMQADAAERLGLYRSVVSDVYADVVGLLGDRAEDQAIWASLKAVFSALISDRDDWDIAETFFNSITRRVFTTVGVDQAIEFVDTDFDTPPTRSSEPVFLAQGRAESVADMVGAMLDHCPFALVNRERDVAAATERIEGRLEQIGALMSLDGAELVRSIFYRGQAAYLVARLHSGSHSIPLVIAFTNDEAGVAIDAVLTQEHEVSILFSFTRSYFLVDVGRPYDLVRFLKRLMPRKRVAEIYIAIGYNKHGKTELYRDLRRHLASTDEQFEIARGTRGLVMIVFTMPGFEDAFKIIRDRFPPQKRTTRRAIMEKYSMVFQHDRAGRLVDAQDFQHLEIQRSRFSDALLDEFAAEAAGTIEIFDEKVVIKQVYVERRVIPLDIYVREAGERAAGAAVLDFGRSIKDLASTNIFPGDLLLKNFGVTRHGRVVFYDYDELRPLTDMRFREIPQSRDDEDEMSSDAWYTVGDTDVFPEEHERFLGLSPSLREVFLSEHRDMFSARAWQDIQGLVAGGELLHVLPYDESARLPGRPRWAGW
ncbi:MAG: bifunctional isocitrate dehydrogenase kinase/phosphatase [Acidimicrobiia bacterium]|nr:bifunctional isocitrate dehydrogenase kinase/phosphatase [Acidimicrobiia bacterium]